MYQSQSSYSSDDNLCLINAATVHQYKNSLKSSSNVTSNIMLEEAWKASTTLFAKNTDYVLDSAKKLLKDSNCNDSRNWTSSLSNLPDPILLFEKSIPHCKCTTNYSSLQENKSKILSPNECTCYELPKSNKSAASYFKPLYSENSSQESVSGDDARQFKPKFSCIRPKKAIPVSKNVPETSQKAFDVETVRPISSDVEMEDEDKAHKSQVAKITFKTAKETLLASNPAARRTLGASRKAQAKFVSPMLGAQDKQEVNEPAVTDERLKHIDPKMVELIESEIIDKGAPIGWEDIAGLQGAKNVIQEAVVWPLLRPDIFTGLRRPPRGVLLFGPPGTGKTLIGKCVAAQCRATFFSISASSLTSKWIGDGEKMVRALFAVARCHQPAVSMSVFIDEIDSLLSQRGDGEHEASRRLKTEFLVQLDGAATGEDDRILIIGATNRPQELDEAARRRLVKRLYIPLPDFEARKQIVSNLLRHEAHSLSEAQAAEVARLAAGCSGADMRALCAEAAMGPLRALPLDQIATIDTSKVRPVNMEDFKMALQRVRPSVSQDDLTQYIKWNNTYGHGF